MFAYAVSYKQTFIFLLLTCFPMVCLGDMVGFAGDTRRYVTESEKYQFPYNSPIYFVYPLYSA